MRIHHSRPAENFTILPNGFIDDERLSAADVGLLVRLLRQPDGWDTNADAEAEKARRARGKRGEGREAMRAIFRKLKDCGYIHHVRTAGPDGRWTTEVHVFDRPVTGVRAADVPETRTSAPPAETKSPQVAPAYGKPGVGSPTCRHADAPESRTPYVSTDHQGLQTQDQGQRHSVANSQNRRVHDGPGEVADDAHLRGDNHPERPAADRNARAREGGTPFTPAA